MRLPHCVVYNRLNWQWNRFPYSDTERTCVFKTSLTFVDSVAEIWAPLLHDTPRTLMVVPKAVTKDPERLINMLHENKVLTLSTSAITIIVFYFQLLRIFLDRAFGISSVIITCHIIVLGNFQQ